MDGTNIAQKCEDDTSTLSKRQAIQIVWPYAVGLAAAVCSTAIAFGRPIPPEIKEVFITTAATAGLLAGFSLTAASILATIGDRPFLRSVKRAGVYRLLISNLFTSMRWCICLTIISIPALLFKPTWNVPWQVVALVFWLFVSFTAAGTSIRALRTFTKLMS